MDYARLKKWLFAGPSEAKIFLILAPLFGLLFIVFSAPMQGPDESFHYLRAYEVSRLDLLADKSEGRFGYTVPTSVKTMTEDLVSGQVPKAKLDTTKIKNYLKNTDYSGSSRVEFENTAIYSPTVYLPQSLAIRLARLVRLPALGGFYLARLFTLLFFILLTYGALRLMPFGRKVLLVLALLPMTLYLGSSISADASIIGFSFLAVALALNILQSKKAKTTTYKVLVLSAVVLLLALSKSGFFAFAFLLLLIPSGYFSKGKWGYVLKASAILVPIILALAWNLVIYDVARTIHTVLKPGALIDPQVQLSYVLRHPFSFLGAVLNTFILKSGSLISLSFIGVFGWLDIVLPYFCYLLSPVIIFYAFLKDRVSPARLNSNSRAIRWVFGVTAVAVLTVMLLSLYTGYSDIRSNYIDGVQGRYFIPIAVLFIPLLLRAQPIKSKVTEPINKYLVLGISVLLVSSIFTLINANFHLLY